jgi:hypothetical protein
MKKALSSVAVALVASCSLLAQSTTPTVITSSYTLVQSFNVAPGQLVTLVLSLGFPNGVSRTVRAPAGADLPYSLAGISGGYRQTDSHPPSSFLEVRPYWGTVRPWPAARIRIWLPLPFRSPLKPYRRAPAGNAAVCRAQHLC